ncbi:uncharacterized protein TNCV_4491171 [Trichonephila clavipes]|nr:uncharacterized protein TNCV_4491171 [Trichonephila clavipes]
MAALVSEYTLEFFTLLNARGKKELIEWCMKEGLIASSYECLKCNEQMGLNERKSVVLDGFEWRCRKKAVDTRRYPRVENRVWSDHEDHDERGSEDRAARIWDPTVSRSTLRADAGVAIVPQTISRHLAEANLKSKRPFRALPLTPEHR